MQVKFHNSVLHFDKVMPLFKSLNLHTIIYKTICCVRSINPILMEEFLPTLLKCSTQQGYVQNPCYLCAGLRSRSHLKVKIELFAINPILMEEFSLNFTQLFNWTRLCAEPMLPLCRLKVKVTLESQNCLVRSINPILMEEFSSNCTQLFNSTRLCAEPMLPLCWHKVKVTLEGQNWLRKCFQILTCTWIFLKLAQVFAWNLKDIWCITSKICRSSFITLYCILTKFFPFLSLLIYLQSILDNMSGLLYKFYTNGRNFFKLYSNVHPNWAMCITHLTLVSAL